MLSIVRDNRRGKGHDRREKENIYKKGLSIGRRTGIMGECIHWMLLRDILILRFGANPASFIVLSPGYLAY